MADRYFAPDLPAAAGEFLLIGPEAHHLATVCRAKAGEVVSLFNGLGREGTGRIATVQKKQVLIVIDSILKTPPPADRTIAVAFPKGDRAMVLIEKCVELGIARIVPLETERSVTLPGEGKRDRLERVIIEACKQCGRNHLMTLSPTTALATFLHEGKGWMLDPQGEILSLRSEEFPTRFAIGPEGGWSDAERKLADSLGWKRVRLAGHVLRVETAALAVAAVMGGLCP
jgi:16S rRNA (uracil1498-N3)-methyltransferase